MKKENSFKRIIVVGNTSPTGYNARFVSSGGGCSGTLCARDYKTPLLVIKKWKRKS